MNGKRPVGVHLPVVANATVTTAQEDQRIGIAGCNGEMLDLRKEDQVVATFDEFMPRALEMGQRAFEPRGTTETPFEIETRPFV